MITTPKLLDPLSDEAVLAAHRAREMTMSKAANTPSTTEAWLEALGSKFVDVRLYLKHEWVNERHIDDPETLGTTVTMSLERLCGRFAVWRRPEDEVHKGPPWRLFDRTTGVIKAFPSQEAAEMVAMHVRG